MGKLRRSRWTYAGSKQSTKHDGPSHGACDGPSGAHGSPAGRAEGTGWEPAAVGRSRGLLAAGRGGWTIGRMTALATPASAASRSAFSSPSARARRDICSSSKARARLARVAAEAAADCAAVADRSASAVISVSRASSAHSLASASRRPALTSSPDARARSARSSAALAIWRGPLDALCALGCVCRIRSASARSALGRAANAPHVARARAAPMTTAAMR